MAPGVEMLSRFLREALRFTMRVTVAVVLMGVINRIPWPEPDRGTTALVLGGALATVVTILVGMLLYDTFYPATMQPGQPFEGNSSRKRSWSVTPVNRNDRR